MLTLETTKKLNWQGLSTKWYIISLTVFLIASLLGKTSGGWLGAWTFTTLIGLLLNQIGDKTPIIKDYLGGGPIVIILGGSLMVYFELIPAQTMQILKHFAGTMDIFTFIVAGLICGSILGMDRKLLIKAGALYIVPLLGGLACAVTLAGIAGAVTGFGMKEAIYMIGFPIMGGGLAVGAIPMSGIYASASSAQEAGKYVSQMMPAIAFGNAMCILSAGLMNKIGNLWPSLSGNGILMKGFVAEETRRKPYDVVQLGMGFVISGTFIAIGTILSTFIGIHYFATTIVAVALVKIFDLVPEEVVESSRQWYDFIAKNGVPAILVAMGVIHIDMNNVLQALNLKYFLICILTVIGGVTGASLFGRLVGFYPIEAGVTAGLCMADMGGAGDLAVLASSKRMELMPFAQISSRIGGTMVVIIVSFVVAIFGLF